MERMRPIFPAIYLIAFLLTTAAVPSVYATKSGGKLSVLTNYDRNEMRGALDQDPVLCEISWALDNLG